MTSARVNNQPTAPVDVRAARPEEFTSIAELVARGFRAGPYGHLPVSDARRRLLDDSAGRAAAGALLVATSGGALLGTATLMRPGTVGTRLAVSGEAELRLLVVDAAARGRGVGEALVHASVDVAVRWGAKAVVLDTGSLNLPAQRLYERLGFSRLWDRSVDEERASTIESFVYSYELAPG